MIQPNSETNGFYEIKGSKFLGFLVPYNNFQSTLFLLKEQHPKACHFVTAFRSCSNTIEEGFSDDGEPKGSAGMPILKVMRGESIVNAGFIAVRYFGGTLLGVGGLVRAYTQVVQNTIVEAKVACRFIEYMELVEWDFFIEYSFLSKTIYLCQKMHILVQKKDFLANGVLMVLRGTQESKNEFESLII